MPDSPKKSRRTRPTLAFLPALAVTLLLPTFMLRERKKIDPPAPPPP